MQNITLHWVLSKTLRKVFAAKDVLLALKTLAITSLNQVVRFVKFRVSSDIYKERNPYRDHQKALKENAIWKPVILVVTGTGRQIYNTICLKGVFSIQ